MTIASRTARLGGIRTHMNRQPLPKYGSSAVLLSLTALYLVMIAIDCQRFIWYDELFTFDIAKASSIHEMVRLIYRWEPNPPVCYFLSRISMSVFGQNALGLRLPSMVEFYLASLMLYSYVRRKAGRANGTVTVLIVWLSDVFWYACEGRPYALIVMLFATLLLCWDDAIRNRNRLRAIAAIGASGFGLVLSHVFAPLVLLPFIIAESARSYRRRAIDPGIATALLLPLIATVSYIPLVGRYKDLLLAPSVQASWHMILLFFVDTLKPITIQLLLAGLVGLATLAIASPAKLHAAKDERILPEEIVLFGGLFINPVLLNLVLMYGHRAFRDRYSITTEITIYITCGIVMGRTFRRDRRAACAAAMILVFSIVLFKVVPGFRARAPKNTADLSTLRPDLPLVDDSSVTFLEMNQYENPQVLSRLYFLKDRDAAVRFVQSTEAEDYTPPDQLGKTFSISANVVPYETFVESHNEFLVFSTHQNSEGWLVPKLQADHASIRSVGEFAAPVSFRGSTLYLVTMPNTQ